MLTEKLALDSARSTWRINDNAAVKATKAVKAAVSAKKPAAVKAPAVSKDELRLQLEKAQNTIATLRTKGREAVKAAKASAAQIADLEAKVEELEKKLGGTVKPAKQPVAAVNPVKKAGRKAAVKADVDAPVETDDAAPTDVETVDEE